MDHTQFQQSIDSALLGQLDFVELAEFEEHEKYCPDCQKLATRRVWALTEIHGRLPTAEPLGCLKPETLRRWLSLELPDQELRALIINHLDNCPDCHRLADEIAMTIDVDGIINR